MWINTQALLTEVIEGSSLYGLHHSIGLVGYLVRGKGMDNLVLPSKVCLGTVYLPLTKQISRHMGGVIYPAMCRAGRKDCEQA